MTLRRLMMNPIRMFSTAATAEKDVNSLTLFVGNLPWTVSKRELQNYFAKFGPISSADVVFNEQTGLSKGHGYVTFSFPNSYVNALKTQNHMLEGKLLNIEPAKYNRKEKNYYNDDV